MLYSVKLNLQSSSNSNSNSVFVLFVVCALFRDLCSSMFLQALFVILLLVLNLMNSGVIS